MAFAEAQSATYDKGVYDELTSPLTVFLQCEIYKILSNNNVKHDPVNFGKVI